MKLVLTTKFCHGKAFPNTFLNIGYPFYCDSHFLAYATSSLLYLHTGPVLLAFHKVSYAYFVVTDVASVRAWVELVQEPLASGPEAYVMLGDVECYGLR